MELSNTLEKERNLIYEPDAVADEEENIKIYSDKADLTVPVFSLPQKIRIKNGGSNAAGIVLILLSVIGFIAGIILCDSFFEVLSEEYIKAGLTLRIKGGFFANAAFSFITMAGWVAFSFAMGYSGISQPVIFLIPAVKCAGTGIMLSSFVKAYGVLNGLLTFSAFILPSFAIGTLLTLYICRCALRVSNKTFLSISGKSADIRPAILYRDYLSKGFIAIAGCFIGGIIDAVISLICSNFFVI